MPELIGVGVDRIKVLLGLILVCTFGCSSGEQNNIGQKPGDTNAHNSLTVTVANGTAAITPDLTSYAAGTRVTIAITPDNGYYFYAWSVDDTGMANPLAVTMDSDMSITAACISATYQNYCTEADQFLFEILSPAESGGSVSTTLKKITISGTVPAATRKTEHPPVHLGSTVREIVRQLEMRI